ncbi:hypothetical protein NBT05_11450 [Aquimarina sp. ERC-38]|uniref:hypothetical protein n=1 Tax=Aquimarina sp. ERC-38 TaxID=2949996 RepID=UPI00224607F8|nr:hypothetical protein [Aquimarina sp. ERC-38]UZO79571.1 hypothetical protein NBT05_11450 [Aquimarina sp. ERC-38]
MLSFYGKQLKILIILLLSSISIFSQSDIAEKNLDDRLKTLKEKAVYNGKRNNYYTKESFILVDEAEKKSFESLARPSKQSEISKFFRSRLTRDDLKKINYSRIRSGMDFNNNPFKKKNYDYKIRLNFEVNKFNKISNPIIITGNTEFNRKIGKIFRSIPIEKLNISDINKACKYQIQLFTKEKDKKVINASTNVVCDELPSFKKCDELEFFSAESTCFYEELYSYILNNISINAISKQKKRGKIKIEPRFTIDASGDIVNANSIAPNQIIKDEVDRVLRTLNGKISPAKRNGKPFNHFYKTTYIIVVEKQRKNKN